MGRYRGVVLKRLVTMLVLAVAVAGCQGESRPDAAEWQVHWDRVLAAVPTAEELESAEDPKPMCDEALTLVREERMNLSPAPEPTLDDPVEDWLNVADETFFECPPRSGDIQGFAEAYERLDDYRAEVDAALGN